MSAWRGALSFHCASALGQSRCAPFFPASVFRALRVPGVLQLPDHVRRPEPALRGGPGRLPLRMRLPGGLPGAGGGGVRAHPGLPLRGRQWQPLRG